MDLNIPVSAYFVSICR